MASRPRSSRLRRALLSALVTASVALPVSGAARPAAVPAPAPAALGPLGTTAPGALAARYAANRDGIRAAEHMAARNGDRQRAASLRDMARSARHFLAFDGRDGGRSAEVFGDLSRAGRIAVLVPGAGVDLDHYWRLRRDAEALLRELGSGSAVVAWLGYRTPVTVSPGALTSARAVEAAPQLTSFVRELGAARPPARVSVLCHSYGSVVCARAASGLDVAEIVLYGSPGTGADSAAALHTRATVRAGRSGDDWIADVPHIRVRLPFVTVGFGTDPVSPEFGAEVFDAGDGGHSDYLKPGSVSLRSIGRIVAGTAGRRA
ncbi:alpha/beta hydrolase [Streptomyces sp. NBC_00887]|uniref:alpha/beta hydrolase n=1 Tax=Streptomyces sp. NBC_00887 TaxID=2975859 RepID=UPI00386C11C5|nr:alpha/beta hydrolase family protein [Streptomyces sp. NBC_00887]WSY35266.1 alpha/beta hydrolase family protein [Streptomyces sp. NBC_00887]